VLGAGERKPAALPAEKGGMSRRSTEHAPRPPDTPSPGAQDGHAPARALAWEQAPGTTSCPRPPPRGRARVGGTTVQRARSLRKEMTEAERALWARLRRRGVLGLKFRCQQPLGRYIVDFVCLERRLIIEVDGGQHLDQEGYDRERSRWLEGQGYRLLRFWNSEVLSSTDAVVEAIATALEAQRYGR
jgi:very-short-patch-repair endonuclease